METIFTKVLNYFPKRCEKLFHSVLIIDFRLESSILIKEKFNNTTATLLERTALYQQKVLPPYPSYLRKRVSS